MNALNESTPELVELLAGCGRRDQRALEALYRFAAPTLLGCLMRVLRRRALAEEALQDVFVQIWQRAAQYDEHRGRPYAWLMSIARYRAIDILRREHADAGDSVDLSQLPDDSATDDGAPEVSARDAQALETCLAQLNMDQRDSIQLAYLGGRSHQQVAQSLDRPLGSVKSWIRRGLIALKECIESCGVRVAN